MGWVWSDEADDGHGGAVKSDNNADPRSSDRCSTRKIVKSQCRTEEVEPGKFVRKCEKSEEILRDCLGRPSEVVQSNKEFTEEDVSEQMKKGSFPPESSDLVAPFDFPGLRSDIEAMERNLFGGLGRFFEAAEEMRNGFFSAFGSPHPYDRDSLSSSSRRRGIPVEEHQSKEASPKLKNPESGHVELKNPESGHVDLSALARDV